MKKIITISREFGSGGRTIGKKLAKELNIAYYDKEMVKKIADESGLSKSFIEEAGEYTPTGSKFLNRFSYFNQGIGDDYYSLNNEIYQRQYEFIKELAEKEPCVIVGRCADYILRGRVDCIHVFIHAGLEFKARRIVELYGNTQDHPIKRLQDKDKRRALFYKDHTGRDWGVCDNYTLSLNSGELGINNCVKIIKQIYNEM